MMKKTVRLYSKRTFTVYKELSFIDKSVDVEKAKIIASDNLVRIAPDYLKTAVQIKEGSHSYKLEILEYPTVITFINKGVISVIDGTLEDYLKEIEDSKKKPKSKESDTESKNTKKTTTKKQNESKNLNDLVPN